ncbi:hypothetical protein A2356_01365 [Candidatus Nomurabacteria bacterium RIFOXYB1_FULL_39_16]|uniref:Apea-like HEPN domain-containing protein n=1 Tax=Candidatus Nomurabacteria bacterium RIFOXYB1_FULL_39_16 TaxID=1801803 RepID=A0A1F6YUV4_9BACT|nr:MAG: hypothetical protein A2356_01365 [Candidatus Nomurabacteria bacterium RIFOXYB1_FULL_39_16]OGJ15262.1 MAG: hypothetical protein A2585_02270 [Candidatus Nomurabacteria bacterium RIFOXYD1_FULL_39_12]
MSKTRSIIRLKLKTSVCNIIIKNGHIGKWFFDWENNLVTAYTYLSYDTKNPGDLFEQTRISADLALLVDVLTIVTNQDINTSVVISTEPIIDSFVGEVTYKSKSVDIFLVEIRGLKHQSNASCLNGNDPIRINDNSSLQLSNEALEEIYSILSRVSAINKYSNTIKKLINYWRKGVDLDHLQFVDESFLSFYKIIEYISKRANLHDKDIPTRFHKTSSIKMAYKFAVGAKLKRPTKAQYEMLSDFIDIRNNWDIAHSKIRPLPNNNTSNLFYSYMDDAWEYHSHICQITRMTLIRELGVKGLSLVNDGGLYSLTLS